MKIYLAGPINGCTDDEAINWREEIKQKIPQYTYIDPMVRDYRGKEETNYREIVDLDKRDIRNSDLIIVGYSKPSVGTSMETFYAWTLEKPIIILTNQQKLSPWLKYHSTTVVNSLDNLIETIERFQK